MSAGQRLPQASDLEYFLEVARTENISRAAERLGITQPTLSLSVQRLEQHLGLPLLLRGKSGVKLTKAGQRFVKRARELLEVWERIRGDTRAEETSVQGRIVVGCHPSVALYGVVPILRRLIHDNPALDIELRHDLSRRITEQIISFEIDLGVVVNPVRHPDLVITKLAQDEVRLWHAQGDYNTDVLVCDPELLQSQALMQKMKRLGLQFRRTLPSSSLEVVAGLTVAGVGMGILPSRVAKRDPHMRLQAFSGKGLSHEDHICLAYRSDSARGLAARAVVEAIRSGFA